MKEITLKDIESLCRQLEIPEIQHLGNNLYKIPGGIICGEKFLEHFYAKVLKSIKEYNTNKSAEHPLRMMILSDTPLKRGECKIKSLHVTI